MVLSPAPMSLPIFRALIVFPFAMPNTSATFLPGISVVVDVISSAMLFFRILCFNVFPFFYFIFFFVK